MMLRNASMPFTRFFAAVLLAAVPAVAAADDPSDSKPPMSPEEQAMMAAWEKAMTPGAQHQWLASMAGNWEFTGTFWMTPGAPPTVSTGTAVRSMMLGGRVMVEKVESTMMEMPFEGQGMTGFDNVSGEWWSTWNDNMGTGVMVSTGKCADHKCELWGSYNDAMSGKKSVRMTSEHGADSETHRMFDKGPDGAEWKTMELVYTRKK